MKAHRHTWEFQNDSRLCPGSGEHHASGTLRRCTKCGAVQRMSLGRWLALDPRFAKLQWKNES